MMERCPECGGILAWDEGSSGVQYRYCFRGCGWDSLSVPEPQPEPSLEEREAEARSWFRAPTEADLGTK